MAGRVTRLVYQPAKIAKPATVHEDSAIGSASNILSSMADDTDAQSGATSLLAGLLRKKRKRGNKSNLEGVL